MRVALCQGKLDSDGGVRGKAAVVVSIHKKGLEDLQKVVEGLEYKTTLNGPYKQKGENRQNHYVLRISNASLELFRLSRKREQLKGS